MAFGTRFSRIGCGAGRSNELRRRHSRLLGTGLALLAAALATTTAHAQLRVVTYNIAQLNGDMNALEDVLAAMHADDHSGFAAPISVIVFQEVQSSDQAQLFARLNASAPAGVSYSGGTFTITSTENNTAGAQAMFYHSAQLLEDSSEHKDIFTGASRNGDRWKLDLVGYDSPDASFYIYSMHLKAGSGFALERADGVASILADSEALPMGTHIMYAGDMNLYSNTEAGYVLFTTPDIASAVDPLGSGSWAGSGNAIKHSQAPCLSGCPLIGGGMDDRFDFLLPTAAFDDEDGLALVAGTYRSFGNDGQHYNLSINSGNNYYYPADLPRSNAQADDLFDASDHIPVVVDFQVPAVMTAFLLPDFGRVIQGSDTTVIAFVSNSANVVVAEGADELNYITQAGGDVSGFHSGAVAALAGFVELSFDIDTTTAGAAGGTVIFFSNSEATQNGLISLPTSGTVVRSADPSFQALANVDAQTVQLNLDADTGVHPIDVSVHNLGFDSLQALLDIDAVTGAAAPFAFTGGLASGIGASPATVSFTFDTTGLSDGPYVVNISIDTSDEDLLGETMHALALTLGVEVGSGVLCPADCSGGDDGVVDILDLLALLGQWGAGGACDTAPGGGDGVVDILDLLDLLGSWGPCS